MAEGRLRSEWRRAAPLLTMVHNALRPAGTPPARVEQFDPFGSTERDVQPIEKVSLADVRHLLMPP